MKDKEKIKEILRDVPIAGKTYEEYIEALADYLLSEGVVEVVRCKDCRRWTPDGGYGLDLDGNKKLYGECSLTKMPCREDHFCSYGAKESKVK